ncbi:hypothetical protein BDW59DRAFT_165919 [Aspergillus cavernicola]|uniref:Rhodopsin domain-containing protein n=1 Tax=Aspergillus cavernicola TaxID=176166 RepID=A0ABR4HQ42_9EURO
MAAPTQDFPPGFLAEDRRPQAIIGMAVATAVAGVVVLTRVYARWRYIQKFGLDDSLICVAMAVNIVLLAVMLQVLRFGAGRHLAAIDPLNAPPLYKWLVAGQLIYMFNLYICRMSGLAFYARLNNMPKYVFYLRLSFGFITAVYIAQTLIIALQCIPLATLWGGAKGKCVSTMVVNIVTATLTIICDSIVLLLPMNIIFHLKAKVARKVALAIILCFGAFAVVTSVCRMVAMLPVVNDPSDATWHFAVVLAWSSAEISAAIIALSLPALKALFGSTFSKEKSSSNNSNSNPNSRSNGASDVPMDRIPKGRIYGDVKAYSNSVRGGRNTSEEVLWVTSTDEDSIEVKRTVRVTSSVGTYKRG